MHQKRAIFLHGAVSNDIFCSYTVIYNKLFEKGKSKNKPHAYVTFSIRFLKSQKSNKEI